MEFYDDFSDHESNLANTLANVVLPTTEDDSDDDMIGAFEEEEKSNRNFDAEKEIRKKKERERVSTQRRMFRQRMLSIEKEREYSLLETISRHTAVADTDDEADAEDCTARNYRFELLTVNAEPWPASKSDRLASGLLKAEMTWRAIRRYNRNRAVQTLTDDTRPLQRREMLIEKHAACTGERPMDIDELFRDATRRRPSVASTNTRYNDFAHDGLCSEDEGASACQPHSASIDAFSCLRDTLCVVAKKYADRTNGNDALRIACAIADTLPSSSSSSFATVATTDGTTTKITATSDVVAHHAAEEYAKRKLEHLITRILRGVAIRARTEEPLQPRTIDIKWGNADMTRLIWNRLPARVFVHHIPNLLMESPQLYECCDSICFKNVDTFGDARYPDGVSFEERARWVSRQCATVQQRARDAYTRRYRFRRVDSARRRAVSVVSNWAVQSFVHVLFEGLARNLDQLNSHDVSTLSHVYVSLMRRGAVALAAPFSFFADRKTVKRELQNVLYAFGPISKVCVTKESHVGFCPRPHYCEVIGNRTACVVLDVSRKLNLTRISRVSHFDGGGGGYHHEEKMRRAELEAVYRNFGKKSPRNRVYLKTMIRRGILGCENLRLSDVISDTRQAYLVHGYLLQDQLFDEAKRYERATSDNTP